MLSLTKNLLKKSSMCRDDTQLKALTVCYWTEFMKDPSIMYNLFSSNPRKLTYDPDVVKVIGTKDGMVNQINISNVEDLEFFHEQMLSVPILLRVWVTHSKNSYVGDSNPRVTFENDLALLIDTSHPRIRPHLERSMEEARRLMHSKQLFCIQIDFNQAFENWLRTVHKARGLSSCCKVSKHEACLFITNHSRPKSCFQCNPLWVFCFFPCWLFSAPCYKCYRKSKCTDVLVTFDSPIVRRTMSGTSGKIIEVDISR